MPAVAEPTTDFDVFLLEDIVGDMTPKCDNDMCDNDATHTITCPCGKGTEFSCMSCIQEMKAGAEENFFMGTIMFDPNKSCGHSVNINRCAINPL